MWPPSGLRVGHHRSPAQSSAWPKKNGFGDFVCVFFLVCGLPLPGGGSKMWVWVQKLCPLRAKPQTHFFLVQWINDQPHTPAWPNTTSLTMNVRARHCWRRVASRPGGGCPKGDYVFALRSWSCRYIKRKANTRNYNKGHFFRRPFVKAFEPTNLPPPWNVTLGRTG